jgi:gamma-glutamyltranspeptidase/glutathione hydrolase
MMKRGGFIAREDLTNYQTVERAPVRADYRGWAILGPPPPAASGVHIAQMLNILEGYDVAEKGFGSAETIHLLAECSRSPLPIVPPPAATPITSTSRWSG